MKIVILSEEGIGNAILRTPLIAALSRHAEAVDVIASERSYNIMLMSPARRVFMAGDRVIEKYDIAVDCQFTSGLLARQYSANYDKLYRMSRQFDVKHEVMHSLPFVKHIFPEAEWAEFTPENYPLAIEKIPERTRDGIIIHTGCLDTYPWRNRFWDNRCWAALCDKLWEEYKMPITLVGSKSEWERCHRIISMCKHGMDYLSTNLEATAKALRLSRLLISLDSGVMHLGASQGTPQVALFGPTGYIKSKPWRPENEYIMIRDEELECSGCHIYHPDDFRDCQDNKCMQNITVDWVMSAVEDLTW